MSDKARGGRLRLRHAMGVGVLASWSNPPRYTPRITVEAGPSATASHVVLPVFDGTFGRARPTLDYPPRPFS